MRDYNLFVRRYANRFRRVDVPEEKVKRIREFVPEVVAVKRKEDHHQIDCRKEETRFLTGLMGEAAVETLLGIEFMDWTVGASRIYHHPDVEGYNVGVKTVQYGKYPVIFKRQNDYSQIICIQSTIQENAVFVCGLATPWILKTFQDDSLILDPRLRAKNTKTGFYGFSQLLPVNSKADIEAYRKVRSIRA